MKLSSIKEVWPFRKSKQTSRLKKKLLLYFILVAVVSISVSAQIIIEMSSSRFRDQIRDGYIQAIEAEAGVEVAEAVRGVSSHAVFTAVSQLRDRMFLMMIVVTASIFASFSLFIRDIVVPMDGVVAATKRIASGDLNVHAPVMSEDEIGQLAELINDMNINMQDLITQVRRELDTYNFDIAFAVAMIGQVLEDENTDAALKNKRLKLSDFKRIVELNKSVEGVLDKMSDKLTSLHSFISTYSNYSISSEVTQKEIDESLSHYR